MIDVYYWTTPNGHKPIIFLEETGLEYMIIPVNIGKGEQFKEAFLKVSPNNRIPAIIDSTPAQGEEPMAVFESGAVLEYLADKTGQFLPPQGDVRRYKVLQWLYWQVGGLGPMAGQNHHFTQYAPEKIPYAIDRYVNETTRLYGVLNKQLKHNRYVAGDDYSIADMAIYPWIVPHEKQGQDLKSFPDLERWFKSVQERQAVKRAYAKAEAINPNPILTEAEKTVLFGQERK